MLQTTKKSGMIMTEYLLKMKSTIDAFVSTGHKLTKEDQILHVFGGLGSKYDAFCHLSHTSIGTTKATRCLCLIFSIMKVALIIKTPLFVTLCRHTSPLIQILLIKLMLLDILRYSLHEKIRMHATKMDAVVDEAATVAPSGPLTLWFNVKSVASLVIWPSNVTIIIIKHVMVLLSIPPLS